MAKLVSQQNELNVLRARNFHKFPWLVHGFSTRLGGFSRAYSGNTLNLGFTKEDSKTAVEKNRAVFLRALNVGSAKNRSKLPRLGTLRQIHSDIIHFVDSPLDAPFAGDGLITATPGLFLGIQTADCLPIILVDTKRHAVGVFHAGWRGTFKRIVEKGLGEMRRHFGTSPRDIKAAIGPGIHGCCYEVGEELREKFQSQFSYAEKLFREVEEPDPVREKYPMLFLTARAPGHSILPKKIFLDLVEANRQQLLAMGVPAKSIEASPLCTNCRTDLLFSYRAEKGKTGRMMAVVGMHPE
ncbi:MAG: peptidoglycan editing factor PgeF [Candidatus Sulfotelmatobacter sp.]